LTALHFLIYFLGFPVFGFIFLIFSDFFGKNWKKWSKFIFCAVFAPKKQKVFK